MKKYTELASRMTEAQRMKFAEYLAGLPESYQSALLRSFKGDKQEVIAKDLGVSRVWVSKMVSRGLKAIGEIIKDVRT